MRILFLCTHNSARSQLGEALLRHLVGDRVEVYSAGTEPTGVKPETRHVLEEVGIHHEGRSKHMNEFAGQQFDYVITTCDEAQEACPVWPGAEMIHWNFPEPVRRSGKRATEGVPPREGRAHATSPVLC